MYYDEVSVIIFYYSHPCGFYDNSWFLVGFFMAPGRFSWFFMVPGWFLMVFHCSKLVFYGSRSVFMVFHGSRSAFMVFHSPRLDFHSSRSVFMVFMVLGWFFIFHIENTLKLYSGLMIQSRPCRPNAGFGLVQLKA